MAPKAGFKQVGRNGQPVKSSGNSGFSKNDTRSGGGGSYGSFTNSSTGETKDFGNTKPPPGWTKAGAVDLSYPDGAAGGAGGMGYEEVDPFAIAAATAEFNKGMQPFVLDLSTRQGFALANAGTENNVNVFLATINRVAPGYGKLLKQMEGEASDFMAGRLPKETKDILYRESAERGVARGVFGQRAQYEGLTSIRDKQLQVMELGFNQAATLRAESDRVAQSLIVNPVTTTLELYSRSLPLFTLAVSEALNVSVSNSEGNLRANIAEGELSLGYANLALNREKFEYDKQQAEAQRKAAERNALFSLVGTGLGAAVGSLGGVPGAVIGAQLGGALGSAAAGNYAGAQASLGQALGTTYGQYSSNSGIFAPTSPPPGTSGIPWRPTAQPYNYGGGTLSQPGGNSPYSSPSYPGTPPFFPSRVSYTGY